jgi:ABC-2 type transport system ATP-binding protein
MKQKLGLICALIHTPQILFLDEPTTGVDPLSRRDFWLILYDLLKEGVTILFSTSYLDEAERCTRVGLIYQGELLVSDTPSNVKERIGGAVLELRLEDHRRGMKVLEGIESLRSLVLSGDKIHILVNKPRESERVIREVLTKQGMEILALMEVRPSLEDAFVSIVQTRRSVSV